MWWSRVAGARDADGACGSSSEDLFRKQEALLKKAKNDADAAKVMGFAAATLLRGKIPIALGFDDCLGAAEDGEEILEGGFKFEATFFRNGYAVSISGSTDFPRPVKVKNFEKFLQEKETKLLPDWIEFKKSVSSIAPPRQMTQADGTGATGAQRFVSAPQPENRS